MASVNKVILLGNLGADPEVRYMTNGEAMANIRMATTETWRDKATGDKKMRQNGIVSCFLAGWQKSSRNT